MKSYMLYHITGANGSGKSTFMKKKVLSLSKEKTSYLGHKFGLFNNWTVIANIKFMRDYLDSYNKELECFFLEKNLLTKYIHQLSYGQQKKLSLLRALCFNKDYWFLDEPSSGLDESSCMILHETITRFLTQGGICYYISHTNINLNFPKRNIHFGVFHVT